jgi:type IV pilus assembly protein PilW
LPGSRGISLLELLMAMTLGALLLAGLVAMVSSAGAASALQRSQAAVQDRARYAATALARAVREAGFRPRPWSEDHPLRALGDGSADDVAHGSDRLVLRAWSDRNCYGNLNPERDAAGRPRFYLRERTFDLSGSDNLTLLCRYGPSAGELTTQISRQGLVPGVESFQVLFGEDADRDGRVERWVPAGAWLGSENVRGVRFGLLVRGDEVVQPTGRRNFTVLDASIRRGSDGRLRRVFDFAAAIRSRS